MYGIIKKDCKSDGKNKGFEFVSFELRYRTTCNYESTTRKMTHGIKYRTCASPMWTGTRTVIGDQFYRMLFRFLNFARRDNCLYPRDTYVSCLLWHVLKLLKNARIKVNARNIVIARLAFVFAGGCGEIIFDRRRKIIGGKQLAPTVNGTDNFHKSEAA